MDPIETYQNPLYILSLSFLLCLLHYIIIHYTMRLVSVWCNCCFGEAGTKRAPMLLYGGTWKENHHMRLLECVICLGVIEEGEKVRILPKCDHTFHVECIDRWLGLRSTCPLCRAALTPVLSSVDRNYLIWNVVVQNLVEISAVWEFWLDISRTFFYQNSIINWKNTTSWYP